MRNLRVNIVRNMNEVSDILGDKYKENWRDRELKLK